MIVEYLMANPRQVPLFDSGDIYRGCRVIKSADEFSRGFLEKFIAEVSNAWEGLSLKLIPASVIPKRPRARIWLPKANLEGPKILHGFKLQNPKIPMNNWSMIKMEEPQKTSSKLLISEEFLKVLEEKKHKLRFGHTTATLKVFPAFGAPDGELDGIEDVANQFGELWPSPTGAVPKAKSSMKSSGLGHKAGLGEHPLTKKC
ncbi:uncharacterized protein LOC129250575 [Anastrepha obliqua]|uniref:uncharacterized protein LOC129250575 n=1 Tax=Anastrepha obliqua TaxID=95512 RepID=UPI0024091019|nr:uncharacterized protein LOC129250575 [Anastrepha obliqua]